MRKGGNASLTESCFNIMKVWCNC